jgi:hypothetical protein
MADSHVHSFDGGATFFMYATHDFSNTNTGFKMLDWWVWTSTDLVNWSKAATVLPQDTPAPQSAWGECWATDGATDGAGHFFFYLSIGPAQVAVLNASSPAGPWTNALGVPLLTTAMGNALRPPATFRDPCVFKDDDGTHYLISGVFDYYIMKLDETLMALAEPPRLVDVINPTGPYGNSTDDKPFLFKNNGIYYLAWGCFYGMADSVYGPYTYAGSVVDTAAIAPAFRMNDTAGPWYSHQDYADRHGSFWAAGGQWFFSANDRSHSTDLAHRDVFRDTIFAYVHFYPNGTIAPVVIDETGVGEYRAGGRVEAEAFFSASGAARKIFDDDAGFGLALAAGGAASFPHVRGAAAGAPRVRLALRAANGGAAPAAVVARLRRARGGAGGGGAGDDGAVLGSIAVPPTGSWQAYARVDGWLDLPPAARGGDFSLVLSAVGAGAGAGAGGDDLVHIDAFAVDGSL